VAGEQPEEPRRCDEYEFVVRLLPEAGVQPVRRRYREQPDVAAILGHQTDRLDRFGRNHAEGANLLADIAAVLLNPRLRTA